MTDTLIPPAALVPLARLGPFSRGLLGLAWMRVRGAGAKSLAVAACAALVAAFAVGAALMAMGARQELRAAVGRLGADILVLPWGGDSEGLGGARLSVSSDRGWFPRSYLGRVAAIEGVEAVTPQLFVMAAERDSAEGPTEVLVVAFEPETDFSLRPWYAGEPAEDLRLGEAVAGAEVEVPGGTINLRGYELLVTDRLAVTGTPADRTLFTSFATAQEMAEATAGDLFPLQVPPAGVSAALVRAELGADPHQIAVAVMEQVPGLIPVESERFFQAERQQMAGLMVVIGAMAAVAWLLTTTLAAGVFSMVVNERRREVGVLRALGATRVDVTKVFCAEAALLGAAGGIVGSLMMVAFAALSGGSGASWWGVDLYLPGPMAALGLVALALAVGTISVTLAALAPVATAAYREPSECMRE